MRQLVECGSYETAHICIPNHGVVLKGGGEIIVVKVITFNIVVVSSQIEE
jgi:hypothetical protein